MRAFDQALQALTHVPEHHDTGARAIDLRLAVDLPLNQQGEYGRRLALLEEAEVLARALDDRARLGQALARVAQVRWITGDHNGAMAAGRQVLDLAAALGDSALQVEASLYLGQTYYAIGDFGRATELLRWSMEAADLASGTPMTTLRLRPRAWLTWILSVLGAFTEGRRHGDDSVMTRGHPLSPCDTPPNSVTGVASKEYNSEIAPNHTRCAG